MVLVSVMVGQDMELLGCYSGTCLCHGGTGYGTVGMLVVLVSVMVGQDMELLGCYSGTCLCLSWWDRIWNCWDVTVVLVCHGGTGYGTVGMLVVLVSVMVGQDMELLGCYSGTCLCLSWWDRIWNCWDVTVVLVCHGGTGYGTVGMLQWYLSLSVMVGQDMELLGCYSGTCLCHGGTGYGTVGMLQWYLSLSWWDRIWNCWDVTVVLVSVCHGGTGYGTVGMLQWYLSLSGHGGGVTGHDRIWNCWGVTVVLVSVCHGGTGHEAVGVLQWYLSLSWWDRT